MTQPPARRNADEQTLLDAAMVDLIERKIMFNQILACVCRACGPSSRSASTCGTTWSAISTMAGCTAA